MSKGIRLTPEQIVAKLREIEVKIGQGKDVLTACREAGATDKSYYRWRREYGGMKVDQGQALQWHCALSYGWGAITAGPLKCG